MTLNAARSLLAVCLPLLPLACAARPPAGGWRQVGGPLYNVSGMALVSRGTDPAGPHELLLVHDNKGPHQPRVASVRLGANSGPGYRRLAWPGDVEPPVDLEAICPVPQSAGSFLALTSAGRLLHLRYEPGAAAVEVLHESILPGLEEHPNLEGFAVQSFGGRTVAIWAERGDGAKPATLYWGTYDPVADAVALHGKTDLAVPFPSGKNTRHVTDLRLDGGGVVWGTSSIDPGDAGPFASALYTLGSVNIEGGRVTFRSNADPTRLWVTRRKVEALELVPGSGGGVYFGADDEAAGGWLYVGAAK